MENLIEILENTPWWVYLIFAYLIQIGIKASKRHTLSLQRMFVLPLVFTAWSLYGLYHHWQNNWIDAGYWLLSLLAGAPLGWRMIHRWKIHVDRQKQLLTLPGTWTTMVLSLLFFMIRYQFGYYYGTHTTISPSVFAADALLSGFLIGLFIGRTAHLWRRYQNP